MHTTPAEYLTMKLRVLSDLHFEFHKDDGQSFADAQGDDGYDVLILAGDIATESCLAKALRCFRRAAGNRYVIYVPGNHEYYGSSPDKIEALLSECRANDPKLRILDNGIFDLDGQRFIGSTLWFSHSGTVERGDNLLNDFNYIEGFREWVGTKARKSSKFLNEMLMPGDVVITHHLPCPDSVHPSYVTSPLNKYFLHDVSPLVHAAGVKLWVHGHTHVSLDYYAGSTRVVCNPFGYARHEENYKFQEHLTVEV